MLRAGHIIRYSYLWARKAAKGQETGRKARPACIIVRSTSQPSVLFVFPLTSQEPGSGRTFMAVTEIECRRGGLDYPSFLILDEYNRFLETEAFDLGAPEPIGTFSAPFMRKVAKAIEDHVERRRVTAVTRR